MSSSRARGAVEPKRGWKRSARALLVIGLAAALFAYVVPVTVAGIFRRSNPEWALKLAPWDARARAATAQRDLATRGARAVGAAKAAAIAAYRRDALAVEAFTALAVAAALEGDEARATRLFLYSERLTRREPDTQLWLIEHEVRRNDIPAALRHYDVALRTTPRLRDVLYPILITASSTPQISAELNRLLATRPGWDRDFLTHVAYRGTDPSAMARTARGLLRPAEPGDREILLILLNRLVSLERPDLAWGTYRELTRNAPAAEEFLRDGDFGHDGGIPPFDWEFSPNPDLMPERRPRENRAGYALFLPSAPPSDGEPARQLLNLRPGNYDLRAVVGDVPADINLPPILAISCTTASAANLIELRFPPAPLDGRGLGGRFAVPQACPYQWLSIRVRGNPELSEDPRALGPSGPWISSITLRPL